MYSCEFLAAITSVFSDTSEINLICWFGAKKNRIIQCWKQLCCEIFLWKLRYIFLDSLIKNYKYSKDHLFETEITYIYIKKSNKIVFYCHF